MLHDFTLAGSKVRLWQRTGESYEHVLMKALGYAMFVGEFLFWGEAGENSTRKTLWLLKHARVERLVLFKIAINSRQFLKQLRAEIPARYRPGEKLILINFSSQITELTATKQIEKVSSEWFSKTIV
jgi:hypothetical protein